MRPGPDPDIILIAPISEIVPAFGAQSGVVGDLVSRHAGGSEMLLGRFVESRGGFVIERIKNAAARQCRKSGAGLDGQLIKREVIAGQLQRFVEFAAPRGNCLAGASVD